jgi:UDP-N-acetylmuramoyl-tripeptide--D-alanyl-D-alanine ligase
MSLDGSFIKSVMASATFHGGPFPIGARFVHDSRLAQPGDIFVALRGGLGDGHDFIDNAIMRGVKGIMVSDARLEKVLAKVRDQQQLCIIAVPDTYSALIELATAWRQQFMYPVVGITGSVGKTSTKELLAHMIRAAGKKVIASPGNYNTALGIALAVLQMTHEYDYAIFEMGISRRGEMALMARLVNPTTAAITFIGHSHLEGLGSCVDIAAEKRGIFNCFSERNIGVINGDQAPLATVSYKYPVVHCGLKMTNQVQARKIVASAHEISFMLKVYKDKQMITMPTNHAARINHILTAAGLAHVLEIPFEAMIAGINQPMTVPGRYQELKLKNGNGFVIHDAYNANPESMRAALVAFEKLETPERKIAVIGDMLELGVTSQFWHRQLGRLLRRAPSIQQLVLVGKHVENAIKTLPIDMKYTVVPTWQEALILLQQQVQQPSAVLIKASHDIGLKNIVTALTQD